MKCKSINLIFCFILIFIFNHSKAQNADNLAFKDKFVFGSDIGIITGSPIGPAEKGAKGNLGIGLHGGIFARYHINDKMGVQLGLAYSAKKAKYETPVYNQEYTYNQEIKLPDGSIVVAVIDTYFNGNVKGEFSNQYIETPILFFYNLSNKWSVHGGTYVAMLLKGHHQVWATGIVGDNFDTVEEEFSDESYFINNIDYGLNAGVNYKLFNQLECELRLSSGMRSIFSDDYQLTEDTIRNIYMELKANYTFQL